MPTTIDEIVGAAKLPETTTRLCLRGDLVAEHQQLEAQLKAIGDPPQSHLAADDPRRPLAERIRALEAEMADAEAVFTFRALGRRKYKELLDQHPREGHLFDVDTFPRALIAACCIDPVMTPTDVDRLFDVLNDGACDVLFSTAYAVNEGVTRVPFSETASAVTRRSATS